MAGGASRHRGFWAAPRSHAKSRLGRRDQIRCRRATPPGHPAIPAGADQRAPTVRVPRRPAPAPGPPIGRRSRGAARHAPPGPPPTRPGRWRPAGAGSRYPPPATSPGACRRCRSPRRGGQPPRPRHRRGPASCRARIFCGRPAAAAGWCAADPRQAVARPPPAGAAGNRPGPGVRAATLRRRGPPPMHGAPGPADAPPTGGPRRPTADDARG